MEVIRAETEWAASPACLRAIALEHVGVDEEGAQRLLGLAWEDLPEWIRDRIEENLFEE